MAAVIRVSAVYTMSDQVSGKLARMATKVTAVERALNNINGKLDKLSENAKKSVSPLGDVNKQLSDMKKTVGTTKGSSGLLYRVDQLQKKLKGLSGGKQGHLIKVSTTGVKSSERDLERLWMKAAALATQDFKIKVIVDKSTVDLLNAQADALSRVAGNIREVKLGFTALKNGEAELRSTMRAKTQAAQRQRKVLSEVSRQMQRNARDAHMFNRAAREGAFQAKSLTGHLLDLHRANIAVGGTFVQGLRRGFPFAKMLPLIAAGANIAGIAIGGLMVMVHGLIAPVLSVVSSLKDMVGVVGLLPAVYASAGVAIGSFMGAVKSMFGDALTNAGKLSEIQKKLDTVKDAAERQTLLDQQKKLLGEMTTEQRKLAEGAADLMKQWRELFTGNSKLQAKFFGTAHKAIDVASKLIKRYGGDITRTADAVRALVDRFVDIVHLNKDVDAGMRAVFRIARILVGTLRTALDPLMTFFGRLMVASERPITRIATAFERWAESLSTMPVQRIERFLMRGIDSASQWWRIIKNIGGAFGNIFRAGQADTQGFLNTLEEVTAQFKQWTGGEGFALIQAEFREGMKVAKALGRFIKVFVKQFMLLGADGEVGKSVVHFIDTLTEGLPRAFNFMANALRTVGPSLTRYLDSLGAMADVFQGVSKALSLALELMAMFNELLGKMPGPLKTLLGLLLGMKIVLGGLGLAFGGFLGALSGGVGVLSLFAARFKALRSVMKGGGGIGKALGAAAMVGAGSKAAGGGVRGLASNTLTSGGTGSAGAVGAGFAGRHMVGPLGQAKFGYQATRGMQAAGLASGGRGAAMAYGARNLAAGAVAGGARSAALRAIPVAGYGLVAYDAIKIVGSDASGMEKTAAVGNLGAITAGGALGASMGTALGPLGTLGGAVVGGVAGATVAPLAEKAGRAAYDVGKYEKMGAEQDQIQAAMESLLPYVRQIQAMQGDLVKTKEQFVKDSLRGQDLAKKENRQAAINYAMTAGINRQLAQQVVAETHRKQQQARITKLQLQAQAGKIKGEKALEDAAKKAGINNAGRVASTIQRKQNQNIQLIDGKEFKVVKDVAAVERERVAQAMAGRYTGKAGPALITEAAADKRRKDAAKQKEMFGTEAGAQAAQFKAYTAQVNKQIADQQAALNKAISQYRNKGVAIPKSFGNAIKSNTGVATRNIDAFGTAVKKQNDATGKSILANLDGWNKQVEAKMGLMATGAAPGGGSSPTGSSSGSGSGGGNPFASPLTMASGGVVPGDSRRPDSVHALLKPGEVVLNEGQQRKLGKANVKQALSGPGTAPNGTFGFGNMQGAPSSALRYAAGGTVPALKPYMDAAVKMGGIITSTTGGKHATNSLHYSGRAFDVDGGPAVNSRIFNAFEPDARRGNLQELFFDPNGGYSGGRSIGAIGGHMDHVHAGLAAAAGAAMIGGKPPKAPTPPNFGTSRMGRATQKRAAAMMPAIQARINAAHSGGVMGGHVDPAFPGSPRAMGQQMAQSMYGWGGSQWTALNELWRRESNWNPTAKNPSSGAYGIPQALPASKMPLAAQAAGGSQPGAQIGWGLNYIQGRYGSPAKALAHHDRMNWYGRGGEGMVTSPTTIGVGDKREHVQITPSRTEATPGGAINSVASQGPARANITNNFYVGVLAGDGKTLRQLANMVGDTIATQLEGAAQSGVADSDEVMSGNG